MSEDQFSNMTLPLNSSMDDNTTCNHFKYMAYTVTYSIMFPFGLFSNMIALLVFLRFTPKKSANIVVMTNLALSDVCFSTTLPFRLIYYNKECHWEFGDWFCRWCVFSFYVNLYTSVLFLTFLSVLRYIAVIYPLHTRSLITVNRAKYACYGIWVLVAALSVPFLMNGTIIKGEKISCFKPGNQVNWMRILRINYVALVLGFSIPFIIILGCYGSIMHKLFSDKKAKIQKQKQRRRSAYLIALILSTFLLSFGPYHVVRTIHLIAKVNNAQPDREAFILKVLVITLCMAAANSCLNPLMYYFAGENFRTSFNRASRRLTRSSMNDSFRDWRSRSGRRLTRGQSMTTHDQDENQETEFKLLANTSKPTPKTTELKPSD